jgi:hypothetical protein
MAKFDGGKVIAHLSAKWSGRSCPMCQVGNWSVQESTYQLLEFNQGGLVLGGPVIPVIPVMCSNCGNTLLVNAITAGIVAPETGDKK